MSNQGFDKKLNLSENVDDRDVINNLGISPIADDIALFINNMRNKSELAVTVDERSDTTIIFDPDIQRAVFTNGTEIEVFDGSTFIDTFYVGNSNNINQFQLFSDPELEQIVIPPAGDEVKYVRSDAVTNENILNLVKQRDPVVETASASLVTSFGDTVSNNPYTSLRKIFANVYSGRNTIAEYITNIESELDVFQQKKQNSIVNNQTFTSSEKIITSGSIIISDPSGINANNVSSASGPGIFILDPATGEAKRAFSDNTNVWAEDGSDLVVDSSEIFVGNLVFDDGVRILRKSSLPEIITETNVVTSFTHYVNVTIEGEEYSLCLK
jgi:hypothetical protein